VHWRREKYDTTAGFLALQFEDGGKDNPIPGYTFSEFKSLHGNRTYWLLGLIRDNATSSNMIE
jgi:hypothetical protein